jgi:hypothetical protein
VENKFSFWEHGVKRERERVRERERGSIPIESTNIQNQIAKHNMRQEGERYKTKLQSTT